MAILSGLLVSCQYDFLIAACNLDEEEVISCSLSFFLVDLYLTDLADLDEILKLSRKRVIF